MLKEPKLESSWLTLEERHQRMPLGCTKNFQKEVQKRLPLRKMAGLEMVRFFEL